MDLLCRACSVQLAPNGAVSLLIFNKDKIPLTEILMDVAPISVFADDPLPKVICLNCLEKMTCAYQFRKKVIETDLKLRQEIKVEYWPENENNYAELEPLTEDFMQVSEDVQFSVIKPESEVGQEDFNSEPSNTIRERIVLNSSRDHSSIPNEISAHLPLSSILIKEEAEIKIEPCTLGDVNLGKVTDNTPEFIPIEDNVPNETREQVKKKLKLSAGVQKKNCSTNSDDPATCEQCGKTYKNKYRLRIHKYRHQSGGFNCDICNKRFAVKENLRVHKRVHSDERPYKCSLCDKAFKQKSILNTHRKIHQETKSYVCSTCGKSFYQKGALRVHERTHTGEKPFVCEFCSARFAELVTLKKHFVTHPEADLPLFPCHICEKTFRHKNYLAIHVKKHHSEKSENQRHQCGTCGKKFTTSGSVRVHMMLHTGLKPYRCKICEKSFRQSGILVRHMRTHSGEKPYPCNVCDKKFPYSHHLLKHMNREHPSEGSEN